MSFNLDMKTIFISLVFGHIFTVILISAYRRRTVTDHSVNAFFLSKIIQALAWALLMFRGLVPELLSIVIANALLFIGAGLETGALLILQKACSPRIKKLYVSGTLLCIAGFVLIYGLGVSEATRIVYASIGTALFLFYPVYHMTTDRTASTLRRLMGILYGIVALSLLLRAAAAIRLGDQVGLFTEGLYQSFSFIALYLIMILGNTGYVLLSKEQADADLLHMASYDEMTGVLNRRTFMVESRNMIHQLAMRKGQVSFILFDIDAYKTINDTYGHFTGDRVLQQMTERLKAKLLELTGGRYLFGRYGGDEFAVLLPDTDEQQAGCIAEQLRLAVANSRSHVLPIPYTISLGVVSVPTQRDIQLNTLYELSDHALYNAKRAGKNQVAIYNREQAEAVLT
ncbi:GGDEF domain-containing protein [Paenibacillus campi]|uniref:GGDEF domain-containing protein n=1 Tax=Paenibacillus campi TaxID=3106031 RepID=UPI002AFFEE12|nr:MULTISPECIES: GGDEF domain-containing protein [unclassified Paenibacillus]